MFIRIMVGLFFLILITQLINANFDHRSSENIWQDIPDLIHKQRRLVKDFRNNAVVDIVCFNQELSRLNTHEVPDRSVPNNFEIIKTSDGSVYMPINMNLKFCQEIPLANKSEFVFSNRG